MCTFYKIRCRIIHSMATSYINYRMYTFYEFGHRLYTFYDFLHSIQHIYIMSIHMLWNVFSKIKTSYLILSLLVCKLTYDTIWKRIWNAISGAIKIRRVHRKYDKLLQINKFWLAIIFGEFGELRVFANICRRQYIRRSYTA